MLPKMQAPVHGLRVRFGKQGANLDTHTTSWQIGGVCRLLKIVFRMRFGILDMGQCMSKINQLQAPEGLHKWIDASESVLERLCFTVERRGNLCSWCCLISSRIYSMSTYTSQFITTEVPIDRPPSFPRSLSTVESPGRPTCNYWIPCWLIKCIHPLLKWHYRIPN